MKVLAINTVCGFGSTGRSVVELAETIIANGDECYIAYGQGSASYKNSYKIGTRLENYMHNACSRLWGNQGYYSKNGTMGLIGYIDAIKPDVIHLRNLHGNYMNLSLLFGYLAAVNKPVVWSLHDCWAYTGKCTHYSDVGCYKWQSSCDNCPQIAKYPPSLIFDRSAQMHKDKKRWISSISNMKLVAVSSWLAGEIKKSFLNQYPVFTIYNWINTDIFRPLGLSLRSRYGISKEQFLVLCVAAGWERSAPRTQSMIRLSRLLPKDIKLMLVGGVEKNLVLPPGVIRVPYVESTTELAHIYSMADVYVHLSTEDTFGKVIAEALACGTPAIVFDSTACPEVVGPGCGLVVKKHDIYDMIEAIKTIQLMGKASFSTRCTEFANNMFNYQINSREFATLLQAACAK